MTIRAIECGLHTHTSTPHAQPQSMCHTHDHEDSVFHKPCPRSTYIIEYVRVSCYTNAFSFFFKCLRAGWMHTLQSFLQCGVVFLACTAGCDVTCRRSLHAYRMQMCTQSCNNPSTLCAVLCIAMHSVLGLLQMCTQSCNDPSTLCAVHSNACVPSASTTNAPTDLEPTR